MYINDGMLISISAFVFLLASGLFFGGMFFGFAQSEKEEREKAAKNQTYHAHVLTERRQHQVTLQAAEAVFADYQTSLPNEDKGKLFDRLYRAIKWSLETYEAKRREAV